MDKWPESGYVDPCSTDPAERPERYFDYDVATGEITPRDGISAVARQRALQSIVDLGLNKLDVMYYRLQWTRRFIADLLSLPISERQPFADFIAQQTTEYVGIARMVLAQHRLVFQRRLA